MNQNEAIGWMGVSLGTLLAFIIVTKLTYRVLAVGQGPAIPEAIPYLAIALFSYGLGCVYVLQDHAGFLGRFSENH